ncbi:MAG: cation:proton antiporter [Oligoflexia bacterium]|nr:cation:proton antiporter [Oligoflexia bacterium]
MLNSSPFIFDLSLILVVAAVVIMICKFLKQPLVLGYLLAGFFVGPHFPFIPNVRETASVDIWAEFGVIFLLFTLGFNFSFKKLWAVGPTAITVAIVKNLTLFASGPIIGYFLNWPSILGFFVGGIISITSTIVVARCLEENERARESFASVVMGILIVEDILVLVIILLISSLGSSQSLSGKDLVFSLSQKIIFIFFIMLVSLSLPKIIIKIRHLLTKETTLIMSIAFCLLISMISAKVGLSPALGAFIAGMLLSETTESKSIKIMLLPIRDLFVAIFFISVGMLIDPSVVWKNLGTILVISIFMIAIKGLCTAGAALLSKEKLIDSIAIGITSIPIGEFSFVIVTLGISMKVINQDFYSITVALSAISILATTYLVKLLPSIQSKANKYFTDRQSLRSNSDE